MANVTFQEAVEKIGNRFDLVLVAARRAREMQFGAKNNSAQEEYHKYTVIALREIEKDLVNRNTLDLCDYQAENDKRLIEI
ncbi:DNA-directed RNA polymerase subunit omega [Candidatus Profftia tarda]|nr:DNA-directed RNA polymerase subunit omega [Candidatus Profftia tarda]